MGPSQFWNKTTPIFVNSPYTELPLMASGEARYMKKKVTTGEIEPDFDNYCINIHYEIEATILKEQGEVQMVEKKRDVKR
jgi:hypothetical protein